MTAWAAIDPGKGEGDESIAIGCSPSENTLCEQIPGCNYRKEDGIWRVPLTWQAWVALTAIWAQQPLQLSDGLRKWSALAWDQVQYQYRLRSDLEATHEKEALFLDEADERTPGYRLSGPQRGGVQWLAAMERCVLEDPMGNGKTPQVIRAMQMRREAEGSAGWRALVIANGAACRNWKREIGRWAPELSCEVVAGTATARRKALASSEADVLVIPWPDVRLHTRLAAYPGKSFTRCDAHGGSTGKTSVQCEVCEKELNEMAFDVIVADEAHRMKDAQSKQTRAVWHLAKSAPCFWAVTGTPVGDSVDDVWAIMHAIDSRGFPSRSRYLDLLAVRQLSWHGGNEVLGLRPDMEAAFHAMVQPWMRRVPTLIARPDHPGRLPDEFRWPEMSPGQRKAYSQLRKLALAELDNGTTMVPPNTVVKFTRMCQFAAASVETFDGEDSLGFTVQKARMTAPSHKADDLLDFLDNDCDGKLVVFCSSPQLLAICEKKLAERKVTSVKVAGGMAGYEQDAAVMSFQTNPEVRVCFITRAGTESITLTAASTILFLQPEPSMIAREQAIGRVDRIGQKQPVRVVYSLTPGTVEERLYELSCEKAERADQVTRDADLMRWMLTPEESA